jgi:hypothetical protein
LYLGNTNTAILLYFGESRLELRDSIFRSNDGAVQGSALLNQGGTALVENCSFGASETRTFAPQSFPIMRNK